MAKKIRANTTTNEVSMLADTKKPTPLPPKHVELRQQDIEFYKVIVDTRPLSDWTPATLTVAAQLARAQSDIAEWSLMLEKDSPIVQDRFGQDKANPIVGIIEAATRRQLALMRSLGLASDNTDSQKRGAAWQKAKSMRDSIEGKGKGLLAQ
jgi:hypothetical protein